MAQVKNKLDRESVGKILKGAGIAGGGVAIVYFLEGIAELDFGQYSVLVAGICAILINWVRQFRKGEVVSE